MVSARPGSSPSSRSGQTAPRRRSSKALMERLRSRSVRSQCRQIATLSAACRQALGAISGTHLKIEDILLAQRNCDAEHVTAPHPQALHSGRVPRGTGQDHCRYRAPLRRSDDAGRARMSPKRLVARNAVLRRPAQRQHPGTGRSWSERLDAHSSGTPTGCRGCPPKMPPGSVAAPA